jgi:tellurite methyltransferase
MEHQAPPTAWNTVFQQEGKVFTTPHEDMRQFVEAVRHHNGQNVLDVGCGSGRHVVYLARHGFSVYGLDNAPEGLNITRQWLQQEGLSADLRHHQMTDPLPYPDATFDAVVSIQVIQQIIAEKPDKRSRREPMFH